MSGCASASGLISVVELAVVTELGSNADAAGATTRLPSANAIAHILIRLNLYPNLLTPSRAPLNIALKSASLPCRPALIKRRRLDRSQRTCRADRS
jgi:hypothetical protein